MTTLDLSNLTLEEASELLAMHVEEIMHATGCAYDKASARAAILHKPLLERIKALKSAALAATQLNERDTHLANSGIPPMPVFSPQMKALLAMPGNATDQECELAWIATQGQTTPPNFTAIYQALLGLVKGQMGADLNAQGRFGQSVDVGAAIQMNERFPALTRAAGK